MKFASCLMLFGLSVCGARAAESPLKIDAGQSRVEVVVKATVDSFTGKLEAYDAAIGVDPAAGEIRSARFAFRFADVKTGKDDRDEQMHSWQDTAHHPDGEFVLASLTRVDGALLATGTLRFHDRAQEIRFPVSVSHERGLFAIDGDAVIDTRDFGLPIIKKFLVLKVDPEVRVRFHLQGGVETPAK